MNNGNWERNGKSCTPEFHLLMFFHLIFTVSYFPLWMCNSQKLESGLTLQVFRRWCPLCGKFLTDGKHRRYEQEMCACSCGYAHCWTWRGRWRHWKMADPQIWSPNCSIPNMNLILLCVLVGWLGLLGFLPFILQTETSSTIVWFTQTFNKNIIFIFLCATLLSKYCNYSTS